MDSKFDLNSFNSDRFSDCSQRLAGGEDLLQFGPNSGSGSGAETRLRQFSEPEPGAQYCGDGQSRVRATDANIMSDLYTCSPGLVLCSASQGCMMNR